MRMLLTATLTVSGLVCWKVHPVQASVWNNAYSYYNTYGNSVVFCPLSSTDGIIYYATKASLATTKTNFRTLGWKVTVQGTGGKVLQTIYFKLGGSYMYHANRVVSGKYEYNLYGLSLYQLKGRMNAKASKAFQEGNAGLRLDACMIVVQNGKAKGAMNDNGPTSGTVYTTYNGIANAAGWNSTARQSLYSYFNKYVEDLFFHVDAYAGEGIKSVSGTGNYCYGTYLTVKAKVDTGYEFATWRGLLRSAYPEDGFYVKESGRCIAEGNRKMLKLYYHRNWSKSDKTVEYMLVRYQKSGMDLENFGWTKEGYTMIGWAESASAGKPKYKMRTQVSGNWIDEHAPEMHLYAVWEKVDTELDSPNPTPQPPIPAPQPTNPTPQPPIPAPQPTNPTPQPPEAQPSGTNPVEENVSDNNQKPTSNKVIRCRFISSKYFEDEHENLIPQEKGGLSATSVWARDAIRRQILRYALRKNG